MTLEYFPLETKPLPEIRDSQHEKNTSTGILKNKKPSVKDRNTQQGTVCRRKTGSKPFPPGMAKLSACLMTIECNGTILWLVF